MEIFVSGIYYHSGYWCLKTCYWLVLVSVISFDGKSFKGAKWWFKLNVGEVDGRIGWPKNHCYCLVWFWCATVACVVLCCDAKLTLSNLVELHAAAMLLGCFASTMQVMSTSLGIPLVPALWSENGWSWRMFTSVPQLWWCWCVYWEWEAALSSWLRECLVCLAERKS